MDRPVLARLALGLLGPGGLSVSAASSAALVAEGRLEPPATCGLAQLEAALPYVIVPLERPLTAPDL
jgi:hypothetical protein